MNLVERVRMIRKLAIDRGELPVPERLQGVSKSRIAEVLGALDLATADRVDAVFALLDDTRVSWFTSAKEGTRFCDGATVAHIACHVGILQRGGEKLDREGRDYWLKPLREIGAIDPVFYDKGLFLAGHPIAKSPNSAHRLAADFRGILVADDMARQRLLSAWSRVEQVRQRLAFQASQAEASRLSVDSKHADLIRACCEQYAPRFAPGFEVVYVDDSDGDRITGEERERLAEAGLEFKLGDPMPDVLLHNRETDELWVIEAVTSDGEVDETKVARMCAFAERNHKETVYFTTAYPSWKLAASRQSQHKNIAATTYVWIREDAAKHYRAESFRT